jgi:hypothetical protein
VELLTLGVAVARWGGVQRSPEPLHFYPRSTPGTRNACPRRARPTPIEIFILTHQHVIDLDQEQLFDP